MHPTLFETNFFGLLPFMLPCRTYGLFMAIAFLLAMFLAQRQAQREGEDAELFIDLSSAVLISGLIGARVVFILTKLDDYLQHPMDILKFWHGGLVWYGGFIGAATYFYLYARKYRLNYFKCVDIFIPYVALAHAIGRFGCLSAGCCFGCITQLPWAITFPWGSIPYDEQLASHLINASMGPLPVHPTQLYEAGVELLLFAVLIAYRRFKRFHGQLFLVWLSVYPIARSVIEMFRGDKDRGVFILSTSQYISILIGIVAVTLAIYFKKNTTNRSLSQR